MEGMSKISALFECSNAIYLIQDYIVIIFSSFVAFIASVSSLRGKYVMLLPVPFHLVPFNIRANHQIDNICPAWKTQ